jgi:LPS sulfotransferase NodH
MKLKLKISHMLHIGMGGIVSVLPKQPKGFIVLAQGRTGSTLLTNLLNSHPQIVCEGEVLGAHPEHPVSFLLGRAARFNLKGKLWGCKAKHYQITRSTYAGTGNEFLRYFHDRGWKVIYLYRRNILKTAISTLVGKQRGKWIYTNSDSNSFSPMPLSFEELSQFVHFRRIQNDTDSLFLNEIPHFTINYEDVLEDYEPQGLADLLHYLELEPHPLTADLRKTSPGSVADSIANWQELKPMLSTIVDEDLVREVERHSEGNR